MRVGYNPKLARIKTDVKNITIDGSFLAHFQVPADIAAAASVNGIYLAKACPAINVAASTIVKAASADTDTLTIAETVALGADGNELKVLLTTALDDTLAVTKTDETKTINIALAKTTAANNTAALIQAAIRALSTVGGISVTAVTCTAGGNWDTAAVATGETEAVSFTGGLSPIDIITTEIVNPLVPRCVTATTDGTAADIKAVQVTIEGTNIADEVITEVLPVFTVNAKTTVVGNKAFKTITKISIPAHDGLAATTSIGFGNKLGLPYKLSHNTVIKAYLDNTLESTAPTVNVSKDYIESNTIELASSLNDKVVDAYLLV